MDRWPAPGGARPTWDMRLRAAGLGVVDRSDHGNDNSQPPADIDGWVKAQQGRAGSGNDASRPMAKGLRSRNSAN